MCKWETFEGSEEFLNEIHRKGPEVQKMVYERKKEIHEIYLKEPLGWILRIIMRELNLSDMIAAIESRCAL
jgi:hypothetical protein